MGEGVVTKERMSRKMQVVEECQGGQRGLPDQMARSPCVCRGGQVLLD